MQLMELYAQSVNGNYLDTIANLETDSNAANALVLSRFLLDVSLLGSFLSGIQ